MVKKKNNLSTALNLAAIVIGMFCMAYAAVPLYSLFCKVTGFGGTTQQASVAPDEILDRVITIRFNSDVSPELDWSFKPEQREVKMHIGENKLAFFSAQNLSSNTLKGTSVYNVTPAKAGAYFNKIQCFCFEEQELKAGEKMEFPVSFFVDPEIASDKNLDDVKTITLSYTFFKVKKS